MLGRRLTRASWAIWVAMLGVALVGSAANAGRVIVTHGLRNPNPTACDKNCVFLNPEQYALNGVLLSMQDPGVLRRIVDQANRQAGGGWPTNDDSWWKSWIDVGAIDQVIDLSTPILKATATTGVFPAPSRLTNCGIGEKKFARVASNKTTDEIKTENERIEKTVQSLEREVNAEASYAKVVTASVKQKAISSAENTQRDYVMKRHELETSLELKDDITLPEHSYLDETVVRTDSTEHYEATGIVTTDAQLSVTAAITTVIGHWIDFADEKARQIPITVKFSVPIHDYVFHHDVKKFDSEKECLDAAAKPQR